jgi:hypothetical protein
MSEILIATIVNASTGEINEVELTAEEISELKNQAVQEQAVKSEAEAKAKARASALAKLKKLGLTAAEIEAL